MKKLLLLIVTFLVLLPSNVYAVYVNGYYRSNGTYVNGYERTAPDGNPYNNYSYPGNYNPNTGNITGGSASSYLNNYYNTSSYSSPSYGGYDYSYTTTPTCPLNSYYDGVSSCKCNYGYSVSGNSCVSQDSLCQDQLGYSSSYDSLNNTCKCTYGYVIGSSGQCTNANSVCSAQIGLMSQYNNSSKKCECMYGYEYNGSSCVYKAQNPSYAPTPASSSYSCPSNSHLSPADQTKCLCDSGFQINDSKTSCVAIPSCADGYTLTTNGMCITYDQSCQSVNNADPKIIGSKSADGKISCNCVSGYNWNGNKCIEKVAVTIDIQKPILESPEQEPVTEAPKKKLVKIKPSKNIAISTATSTHLSSSTPTTAPAKSEIQEVATQKYWYQWINPFYWFK